MRPGSAADVAAWSHGLVQLAAARARYWFPELPSGPPQVTVVSLGGRPRCALYVADVSVGSVHRRAVVKIRRDEGHDVPRHPQRPNLVPDALGAAEQALLEHAALVAIERSLDPHDSRFGVVRALDHVPELDAVVMGLVDQPTLRRTMLAQSRLGCSPGNVALRSQGVAAWHNAGAWLRNFHRHSASFPGLRPRLERKDDVLAAFRGYEEFLAGHAAAPSLTRLVERAVALADDVLPDQLPLAVGHGDFVARNIFADRAGQVSVFDPLPRWRVPVYEDLCRFLVGMRLAGVQVLAHGLAYSGDYLDVRENAFLTGYFCPDDVPAPAVNAFQTLVLLDKWAALTSRHHGQVGWRRRAGELRVVSTSRYLRHEATRLVDAGERIHP